MVDIAAVAEADHLEGVGDIVGLGCHHDIHWNFLVRICRTREGWVLAQSGISLWNLVLCFLERDRVINFESLLPI